MHAELLRSADVVQSVRMIRRAAILVAVGMLIVAAAAAPVSGSVAGAKAGARTRAPVVLRPRWHQVLTHVVGPAAGFFGTSLWSNGRFVLYAFEGNPGGVLIDDQTGKRARLDVPDECSVAGMGAVWLGFGCGGREPSMTLYRLGVPVGYSRTVAPSPDLSQQCNSPDFGVVCELGGAVGTHWVAYSVNTCMAPGVHCSSPRYEFQNLDTGQLVANPASVGGTVIPDLESPTLARQLCSPLRVPSEGTSAYDPRPVPGTLTLYGRFAVSSLAFVDDPGDGASYLHKCGSHMNEPLSAIRNGRGGYLPPVGNRHVIVWSPNPGGPFNPAGRQLNAVLLPSLQRLVIRVPADIGATAMLALGPKHLYMISDFHGLWATTNPALLIKHGKKAGPGQSRSP